MSRRRESKSKKRREARRYTTLANARPGLSRQQASDRQKWPIVASFVPEPDVWRVSGCGTAAVCRQRPDGKIASAIFGIELMQGGITGMWGKDDHTSVEDFGQIVKLSQEHGPPLVPGEADLVTRYVYGAYAFGLQLGFDFPPEQRRPRFSLLPPMSGTPNWWLQQLTHDGLTPARLVQIIQSIDVPNDLPEGKELVCFTTAIFEVDDGLAACRSIEEHDPEFIPAGADDDGYETFTWSREYPKSHSSPLASLGGRQILGDVHLRGTELRASCKVMSMAGKLVMRLKQILGDSIRLHHAEWQSVEELLEVTKRGHV